MNGSPSRVTRCFGALLCGLNSDVRQRRRGEGSLPRALNNIEYERVSAPLRWLS